jgi:ankyrin repeat protein
VVFCISVCRVLIHLWTNTVLELTYDYLSQACTVHHPKLVEFFLKHGADANLQSGAVDQHKTPLMFSAQLLRDNCEHVVENSEEMLQKVNSLFELKYPNYRDEWIKSNRILLDYSAQPYQVDDTMTSSAIIAASQDVPTVLLEMLRYSAKKKMNIGINNVNGSLNSVLMLAVQIFSGRYENDKENQKDYEEAIEGMLKLGSDVNMRNREQQSALMIALQKRGIKPIVNALLTNSVNEIKYSVCNKGI